MPDFRQLHDEEIHALYAELASQYEIPALNRNDPSIKYGLRNADGTGVVAGVRCRSFSMPPTAPYSVISEEQMRWQPAQSQGCCSLFSSTSLSDSPPASAL